MKKLCTADLFKFARLVKTSDIRTELTAKVQTIINSESIDIENIGIDTMLLVMEKLAEKNTETAIYEFLSNPFEMTSEEVAELDINSLFEKIKQLADMNDLKSFFSSAFGIAGKK